LAALYIHVWLGLPGQFPRGLANEPDLTFGAAEATAGAMNDIATTIATIADVNKLARKKISVPYAFL
jgi:hypothetical protein